MKASTMRAFISLLILVTATASATGTSYTITDLGTLGGTESYATGINNSGEIVGNSLINLNVGNYTQDIK